MGEEIKQVANILNNIENLNDSEKEVLRKKLIPYYYINSRDEYMELYNSLSEDQLAILLDIVGLNSITDEFITKLNNKKPLIKPYSFDTYYLILKNKEAADTAISTEIFYNGITDLNIDSILDKLTTDEQKRKFVGNCIKYKPDAILGELSRPGIPSRQDAINYVSDNQLIDLMKQQDDSKKVLEIYAKLSDEGKITTYRSEWFRELVDVNNMFNKDDLIRTSPDEIVMEIIDRFNVIPFLNFYKETNKTIFLKIILDRAEVAEFFDDFIMDNFVGVLFSLNDKKLTELGEYKDKLIELISNLDDSLFLNSYFAKYRVSKLQDNSIKELMFNKAKYILENTNYEITKISPNIINSNEVEVLDLIIQNVSKEDLLLLAIRNEIINNYVMNILANEPDYFVGISISDNQKYPTPIIEKNRINELGTRFLSISEHLSEEQLTIYFIPFFINYSPKIKELYINKVTNNYNYLTSLSDLNLFSEALINDILSNLDMAKIMSLVLYKGVKLDKKITSILKNNMDKRVLEMADFINDPKNEEFIVLSFRERIIFSIINEDKREEFINLVNNKEILCRLLTDAPSSIYDLILNRLIYLYNNEIEIQEMSMTPFIFDEKKEREFFERLSFDALINLAIYECRDEDKNSKKFKKYIRFISEKIDKDINVLFTINVIANLEELLTYLPEEKSTSIKNYIDDKYLLLKEKYPNLSKYINSYSEKANYIYSIKRGFINDTNYDYVASLLNKNKSLFNSMDFRLLQPDIMKMGNYFIDKTSRYPIVATKLLRIYESDISKFNCLVALSNKMRLENSDTIYDQKIEMIIDYLLTNDIGSYSVIDDNLLLNIENYIIDQYINKKTNDTNFNVDYIKDKNAELDKKIVNCSDINDLKKLIYHRYFGLNERTIANFLFSYALNWNSVASLSKTEFPNQYIENILAVKNASDVDELRSITSRLKQFTITDNMKVKSEMITTYNKCISRDIKKTNFAVKKRITIGDSQIEVDELPYTFGIFVHSTDAYGSMPLINDDYYESWNYNPNTKNHGICTSYITNSSYGTAAVRNKGVMFGFTNIQENSISLSAPYDLATRSSGYNIASAQKPFFGNLKTISDYTRHTHNETTLERRVFDANGESKLRQPDCIIIFEDMPEEIKKNSIKAYEDFLAHGIKLEIKYIDRVKNAKREAHKLDLLIAEYENNFNLDILKYIINIYEGNICSCDYLGIGKPESANLFDQHELFKTDIIKQLLSNTIERISNIEDADTKKDMANTLNSILMEEQYKFDIIKEVISKRAHKFEIFDSEMKAKMNKLLLSLNKLEGPKLS